MVSRFVKGFVAAIQYAQNHREFTLEVLSKFIRTTDAEILNASYDYYVGRIIPRVPYVSEKGLQGVTDFIRQVTANAQRQGSRLHGQSLHQRAG